MDKRHGGIAVAALLAGLGLAAALGCGGSATTYNRPVVTGFKPAQAKAGDTVIIGGGNFEGTTTVSFEGAPSASFNQSGGVTIATTKLVVAPVISGLQPDHGPAGTTVTLTGTGLMGVTALAIGGDASSTFTPYYSPTQVMLVVGAGAVTGPVTLTASGVSCTGPQFTVEP